MVWDVGMSQQLRALRHVKKKVWTPKPPDLLRFTIITMMSRDTIYIYIINPILQSCLIILVLYVRIYIYIYILVYILQYHQGQKTIGKHHRRNHSFCRHEARSQPCHWIWLPGKQRNCRPFGCPSKTCRNVPWVVFVLKIEMWKSWFWYDSVIWSIVIIYTLICIDHTVS